MLPAGALAVTHCFRGQERGLELVGGADVRFPRARPSPRHPPFEIISSVVLPDPTSPPFARSFDDFGVGDHLIGEALLEIAAIAGPAL
jgi:hypothetical protein